MAKKAPPPRTLRGKNVPPPKLGRNGDLYVRDNGEEYKKVDGKWVITKEAPPPAQPPTVPKPPSPVALLQTLNAKESQIREIVKNYLDKKSIIPADRRAASKKVVGSLDGLRRMIPDEAHRIVRDSYENAYKPILQRPGVDVFAGDSKLSTINREAVNLLADNLANRLDDAAQTLGRRVDDVFRRHGLAVSAEQALTEQPRGLRSGQLRRRLEAQGMTAFEDVLGRKWQLSRYADMVVRTTVSEAHNRAVVNGVLSLGHDLVRVDKHEHETDMCSPYDGKTFSLTGRTEGYPVLDRVPPFHPNAVLDGTFVLPIGRAEGGSRASWSGPVIRIETASGVELTISPNHPVLTGQGWIPAKFLRKGDNVVRRLARERVATTQDLYVEQEPALVEDVFNALRSEGMVRRFAATPSDFHDDGNFCQGKVDVVTAKRLLLDELDLPSLQPVGHEIFVGACAQHEPLAGSGSLLLRTRRVGLGSAGSVSLADVSGAMSDRHASSLHTFADVARANADLLPELSQGLTCDVALDQIVHVWEGFHTGLAFDLQTPSGMYWADSIAVHNCKHNILPARENYVAVAA